MALFVRNSTPNTVSVAIGYPNKGCFEDPVTISSGKRGWYNIPPGRRALVFGGQVDGRYFFLHAHDAFGNEWGGTYFTDVPSTAFDMCWIAACSPCRRRGFDRFFYPILFPPLFTQGDKTISITLSSSKRTSKSPNIRVLLPTKRKLKYRKYSNGIFNKKKRLSRRLKKEN